MNSDTKTATTSKTKFQEGYEMLPAKHQKTVRLRIMNECGWTTRSTFINKQKGYTLIRKSEIPIIEEIFKQYNLDPWTGKYLNE